MKAYVIELEGYWNTSRVSMYISRVGRDYEVCGFMEIMGEVDFGFIMSHSLGYGFYTGAVKI